jgi:hypothetical protein
MTRLSVSSILSASLFLVSLATPTLLLGTSAHAAQVYYCICNGEKQRLFASTRYCEHQHNVKRCSQRQFDATYAVACKERGCRFPRAN